jgi:hypothetical protein
MLWYLILIGVALGVIGVVYLLARTRIGRIVLAGCVGLVVIGIFGRARALESFREIPVQDVTVAQAAQEVAAGAGAVRVVVVYDPSCGLCQRMVPEIARYVRRRARDGARLYAFALARDANDVRLLLAQNPGSFVGYQLLPYRPGDLGASMATVNVAIPARFGTPIVNVLASDGSRAGTWESMDDLTELGLVMDSLLTARGGVDVKAH